MRGDPQKWCFQLMHWKPQGYRNVGRPHMRFCDQFDHYWLHMKRIASISQLPINNHWLDIVYDSRSWAKQVPAFIEFHS